MFIVRSMKQLAKRIPLLPNVYRTVRAWHEGRRLRSMTVEARFVEIFRNNGWAGTESVSGLGSDSQQTRIIRRELPPLLRALNVCSVLDLPCGDYAWMRDVDLDGIDYLGADIVSELIENCSKHYAKNGVRFRQLNLLTDELPKVDLVFCRDCLVHLSVDDIFMALRRICASQSEYLLTTTFPGRTENRDIVTGQWRAINLELPPFELPKPRMVIVEGCTEFDGDWADKSLALWKIDDIEECISQRHRRSISVPD